MSPDRIIITRAEAIRRRKEEEQKQREKLAQKKVSIPVLKSAPKREPKPKPTPLPKPAVKLNMGVSTANAKPVPVTTSRWRRKYEIAASAPAANTQVLSTPKVPAISFAMPHIGFGPRLISFFLAVFCAMDLYFMLNYDPFIAYTADIAGNNQISTQEIQNVLGISNIPTAILNPAQVQINILGAFPNILSAQVDVNFPGSVVVSVVERTPIAAWQQDGQTVWVDAQGYAFPPRGQVDNLPTITALGTPPTTSVDPAQTFGARPFLPISLSQGIISLSAYLPKGAQLIFDPQYGLGWNDPQGWKVFFGRSNENATLKYQVYQSMLAFLGKKSITPTLINVEYPNAPFYQMAQ